MNVSEVEQTLLGMCLSHQADLGKALSLGLHPGSFEDYTHREILAGMLEVEREKGRVDLHTMTAKLPLLAPMMTRLCEAAPLAQNVEPYAREVLALARSRQIQNELLELANAVVRRPLFEGMEKVDEAIGQTFNRLLLGQSETARGAQKIDEALDVALPEIEREIEERKKGKPTGIDTGFKVLNLVSGGGFAKGSVITAAARTGIGKTTLALNFLHTAAMAGYGCAYFTVEMPTGEIIRKLLSLSGKISGTQIRNGDLGSAECDRLMAAHRALYDKRIWIDDSTGASFDHFRRSCERIKRRGPLDLVVVDYVQQFRVKGGFATQTERVAEVSRLLKDLAVKMDLVVINLAQLNREATKDDMPGIHHIKDSGAIEQDSDMVLLLHRFSDGEMGIYIGKNRWGKYDFNFTVEANLAFNSFKDTNINLENFR